MENLPQSPVGLLAAILPAFVRFLILCKEIGYLGPLASNSGLPYLKGLLCLVAGDVSDFHGHGEQAPQRKALQWGGAGRNCGAFSYYPWG